MKKLNTYINEAWGGVKKQSYEQEINLWCEEMGIENYTINSQGEIDVDGDVWIFQKNIKELPYKFGTVRGYFNVNGIDSLKSCKNFPNDATRINISGCTKIQSLEGIGEFYELYLGYNMIEDFYPLDTINFVRFKDAQCVYGDNLTNLKTMEGLPKKMQYLKLTNCPNLELSDYSILPKISKGLELSHNQKIININKNNIDVTQLLANATKLRYTKITIE